MQDLTALLVQTDTVWEDPQANFRNLDSLIGSPTADLIVLPETFSTGFSMKPQKLAESMDGATVTWMKQKARSLGCTVTGTVIIKDGGNFFNRLLWVSSNGEVHFYDKRHLFAFMGEDKDYTPGLERKIFSLKGWRFCPQVCYDLRFPVWCRNCDDYDVLLFTANWPAAREYAWTTLLHARAIENQSYVIGVNRVGKDGNALHFNGGSLVIDALGTTQNRLGSSQEATLVHLKAESLGSVRRQFPFLLDRDPFEIG